MKKKKLLEFHPFGSLTNLWSQVWLWTTALIRQKKKKDSQIIPSRQHMTIYLKYVDQIKKNNQELKSNRTNVN